jgi:hypothetical protein
MPPPRQPRGNAAMPNRYDEADSGLERTGILWENVLEKVVCKSETLGTGLIESISPR